MTRQACSTEASMAMGQASRLTSKQVSLAEGSQSTKKYPAGLTPSITAFCHFWAGPALAWQLAPIAQSGGPQPSTAARCWIAVTCFAICVTHVQSNLVADGQRKLFDREQHSWTVYVG